MRVVRLVLLVVLIALTTACGDSPSVPSAGSTVAPSVVSLLPEVSAQLGLQFTQESGATGNYHFPEMGGTGAALLDANEDGRLDLYLLDGGFLDAEPRGLRTNRLFLQQADGHFRDATKGSGADHSAYAAGCAMGDIDNDGHQDLYLSNVGPDVLLVGRGDGTFEDVSERAGIRNDGWGTSVTMLDFDADGFLDIYIANYVEWPPRVSCSGPDGRRDYCNPAAYPPRADVLYRNRGDRTFADVSHELGIDALPRRGLGVVAADLNGDGWTDLYVANDGEENHLWINQRGEGFEDQGLLSGAAVNSSGQPEASMGVALGDVNEDGHLDLLTTHLRRETNTLYLNDGEARFRDGTDRSGLGALSLPFTGFGTAFLDLDLDGHLDLAIVNGRVTRGDPHGPPTETPYWDPYREQNLLFHGRGGGRFEPFRRGTQGFTDSREVSRGLVVGDLDGDGDLDLVVTNIQGPAQIFRNDLERQGHWLQVEAWDPTLNRTVYGARVQVKTATQRQTREINSVFSFQSSSDWRAHFGLGPNQTYESIHVVWPGGAEEVFGGGKADRTVRVERGAGK